MPPRDVRMYLYDVAQGADRIARLTDGKSLTDYQADENLRLIVERSFEIIGEALRQAVEVQPSLDARITKLRRIIDFRNTLIHAYHMIDPAIVWDIVQGHLPLLRREVKALLEAETPKGCGT
jgi:uncharacterized protein with HEPN domain